MCWGDCVQTWYQSLEQGPMQKTQITSAIVPHIPPLNSKTGSVHVLSGNLPDLVGEKGCMGLPLAAMFPWPSLTVMCQVPVRPSTKSRAQCSVYGDAPMWVLGCWPGSTHYIGSLLFPLSHSVLGSKRDVSTANFSLHEAHCLRFLTLCSECDEPVARKDMKDHQTEAHKQVRNAQFSSCNQLKALPALKYSHGTVPSINYIWTSTIVWAENL